MDEMIGREPSSVVFWGKTLLRRRGGREKKAAQKKEQFRIVQELVAKTARFGG